MVWYGDSFEQQINFYLGGWEKFHSGDLAFWEWSLGFGGNYLSYLFYFAASPFFFIYLLFPKESIIYLFLYFNAIKLLILMVGSYLWLRSFSSLRVHATLGALALTFSGWIVFFFHYNQFLDIFIYYPIILVLVERWLIHQKSGLWISVSLGALGLINFYFLYMFIPFLGLYVIYRLVYRDDFSIQKLSKFIGFGLLGVGLSSALLLPSLAIISNNSRIQTDVGLLSLLPLKDAYRYLSTLFTPVMERFDPSYFLSTSVYGGLGWAGGVSLYTSILTLLVLPLNFIEWKTKKVKASMGLYGVLGILVSFLIFYKLLQGSVDVRWYFMITLFNIMMLVQGLDKQSHGIPKSYWVYSILGLSIIVVGFASLSIYKQWYGESTHLVTLIKTIGLALSLLLVYGLVLSRAFSYKWLLLIMVLETQIAFYLPIVHDQPIKSVDLVSGLRTHSDAIDVLMDEDKSYYRILNDTGTLSSANEPFAFGYWGLSFYTSTYNYEQDGYLDRLRSTWSMPNAFGRNYTYLLTSVKYFITTDKGHLPPYGFDFYKRVGKEFIYANRYYLPMGFATTQTLNSDTFKSLSYLNQDRILMDHIVTDSSLNTEVSYFNTLETIYQWASPTPLYVELKDDEPFNLYVESFDIPVITIEQRKDETVLHSSYTWQYNYTGEYVSNPADLTTLAIVPNNLYQSPSTVNVYKEVDLSVYDRWYESTIDSAFYNIEISKDYLKANIHVFEDDSTVFTSVAYDKGWTLFVDDVPTPIEKVDLGFVGFKANAGIHEIRLSYIPPYLKEGVLVSTFSFIILSVLALRTKPHSS